MRMRLLVSLLAAALCASTGALARDQLGERDEVVINPNKAYIFFRSDTRSDLRFLREVDEAQMNAWRAQREVALERARRRSERSIASWDRDMRDCRGGNANSAYCRARGPRPVPVTDENFAFAPPELDNFVDFSRGRTFTRADGAYTYLRAVEPGTYILYGPVAAAGQMVTGVCYCMGSIRFEARPGEIVDIGELRLDPEPGPGVAMGRFTPDGRIPAPRMIAPSASLPLPDRLTGHPVTAAELRAADPMPNYFGILIERLAPIDGVLAYDRRGQVVDVRSGQASASAGN